MITETTSYPVSPATAQTTLPSPLKHCSTQIHQGMTPKGTRRTTEPTP